jgi:urease gamma subunit
MTDKLDQNTQMPIMQDNTTIDGGAQVPTQDNIYDNSVNYAQQPNYQAAQPVYEQASVPNDTIAVPKRLDLPKALGVVALIVTLLGLVSTIAASGFNKTTITKEYGFADCSKDSGKVNDITSTKSCELKGVVYFDTVTNDASQKYEEEQAKKGMLTYLTNLSVGESRTVIGNTYADPAISPGVVEYFVQKQARSRMVINNLLLPNVATSSRTANEILVSHVIDFLAEKTDYKGEEPLGNESIVLNAFAVYNGVRQTKTLGEFEKKTNTVLAANRSIWGVDGTEDKKTEVMVRAFGAFGNNVIMLESPLSVSDQLALESKYWETCMGTKKTVADRQACYNDALRSDEDLNTKVKELVDQLFISYGAIKK